MSTLFGTDPYAVGETPDYRYSLANERTLLAWLRTALALVGGGLAVEQFLGELDPPWLQGTLAASLLVLGAVTALRAVRNWRRSERAIRLGDDFPPSRYPVMLAVAVAIGAVVLVIAVLVNR